MMFHLVFITSKFPPTSMAKNPVNAEFSPELRPIGNVHRCQHVGPHVGYVPNI